MLFVGHSDASKDKVDKHTSKKAKKAVGKITGKAIASKDTDVTMDEQKGEQKSRKRSRPQQKKQSAEVPAKVTEVSAEEVSEVSPVAAVVAVESFDDSAFVEDEVILDKHVPDDVFVEIDLEEVVQLEDPIEPVVNFIPSEESVEALKTLPNTQVPIAAVGFADLVNTPTPPPVPAVVEAADDLIALSAPVEFLQPTPSQEAFAEDVFAEINAE